VSLPAIELHELGKRYWKLQERSLLRSLVPLGGPNRSALWALQDIDLRVEAGETVGLIGRNGAGKSTLLRLLAGVSQPTTGSLVTRGRIAPLLSVGVGFHEEMTGRENVLVNGMLLGLSKSRINALFSDIVDFAELGDFIDTPVKFYSSGMFMRLGFSVAIHTEPDVLLVDEVLAVGDVGFRLRSFERMRALQQSGAALVFVSQWLPAVQVLCPRAVCLHRGRVVFDGPSEGAVAKYHELLAADHDAADEPGAAIRILEQELVNERGAAVGVADQGDLLTYRARLCFERSIESPQLQFRVIGEDSTLVYAMQTAIEREWRSFAPGEEASVVVPFRPQLGGGGTFRISLVVSNEDTSTPFLHDEYGPSFFLPPRIGVIGYSDLGATIAVDGETRTNHPSLRFENHPASLEGA
jgi:ABC-2 type transport system ATP-binding protein